MRQILKLSYYYRPNSFFFVQDFSEKQSPSHWRTITCQADPSDCGAFTRHCLWVGSSPQGLSMVKRLRRKVLYRSGRSDRSCILPLAAESIRASKGKHQSQPGRLRYFLNRMPSRPSKQQPLKKFSEFSVLSVDKKNGLWVAAHAKYSVYSVVHNEE